MRKALLALALASALAGGFWPLLASIWEASSSADAGLGMDPDGKPGPSITPQTDAGFGMDPDG